MLNKLKKNNDQGFTIIEVMIVLAIAGLILLIVFLAVPALQRSARNTQRKNDVASLSGGVANYISNNNGGIPGRVVLSGGTVTIDCGTTGNINGTHCDTTDTNTETAKVSSFTTLTVNSSPSTSSAAPDTNTLVYVPGWTCNSSNTGLGSASSRTAAFLYQIENGGSAANECLEQ